MESMSPSLEKLIVAEPRLISNAPLETRKENLS